MNRSTGFARPTAEVVEEIIRAAQLQETAQAPGYKAFRFVRTTDGAVIVGRESGKGTVVPKTILERAIEFVRGDHTVYVDGPGRLREVGITHVNSPTWALIRLLPLNDLIR